MGTVLAERFGVTPQTIYKWRHRDSVNDRSHTPHRLQTTLTPAQEAVAVSLRQTLLLSLDDLLAVVREFLNPNVSRSGLDRCLRRHGVGNLRNRAAAFAWTSISACSGVSNSVTAPTWSASVERLSSTPSRA